MSNDICSGTQKRSSVTCPVQLELGEEQKTCACVFIVKQASLTAEQPLPMEVLK